MPTVATVYRDIISSITGHPMSGLWTLLFESGAHAHIESGYGVRQLAACFGATEGSGDLLEKIAGQEIVYSLDDFGVLEGFTPIAEWLGPEVPPGESITITQHDFDQQGG